MPDSDVEDEFRLGSMITEDPEDYKHNEGQVPFPAPSIINSFGMTVTRKHHDGST
jgi:hypothetical protein